MTNEDPILKMVNHFGGQTVTVSFSYEEVDMLMHALHLYKETWDDNGVPYPGLYLIDIYNHLMKKIGNTQVNDDLKEFLGVKLDKLKDE